MRARALDIDRLLRAGAGVVTRRDHLELASSLHHLVRSGRLRRALPGVYVETRIADHPVTRMRALAAYDPDAVLTGEAAAKLTFWPDIQAPVISAAVRRERHPQPGYRFTQSRVPPELVVVAQGLRCTSSALTALDLATTLGGDAIDVALRSRTTSMALLHEALLLTRHRRGNVDRRELLLDSRSEPWSAAERRTHRLLRSEGITGWSANYPVPLLGVIYYLDVAFPALRLALEIDGRAHHSDAAAFERDRWRQNDLVLAGWRVLRFTWWMVTEQPHVVAALIRRAVEESRGHGAGCP